MDAIFLFELLRFAEFARDADVLCLDFDRVPSLLCRCPYPAPTPALSCSVISDVLMFSVSVRVCVCELLSCSDNISLSDILCDIDDNDGSCNVLSCV
jgi:hypothetical protein